MAASNKEKHRYVNTRGRIELGTTTSHLVALGTAGKVLVKRGHKAAIFGLPL